MKNRYKIGILILLFMTICYSLEILLSDVIIFFSLTITILVICICLFIDASDDNSDTNYFDKTQL